MNMEKARKAILSKVSSVNDLVALGLMEEMNGNAAIVRIEPILFQKRDKRYIKNWCQNVLRVWCLTYNPKGKDIKYLILTVRDKMNNLLCEYSDDKGLIMKSKM